MSSPREENRDAANCDDQFTEVNASGHKQELERHFGLLSICAFGINTGCSWPLMGGILVSMTNSLTKGESILATCLPLLTGESTGHISAERGAAWNPV